MSDEQLRLEVLKLAQARATAANSDQTVDDIKWRAEEYYKFVRSRDLTPERLQRVQNHIGEACELLKHRAHFEDVSEAIKLLTEAFALVRP